MSDEQKERTWPCTIKLRRPVDFAGETVSELVFRRGTFGDLKGISLDGMPPAEKLMGLAARLCDRHIKVIEALDADDVSGVLEVALSFFVKCLGTTGKS